MKSYKVKYSTKSIKFLKKNKIYGLKFYKAFEEIAKNKNNSHKYDIKKLQGKNNENLLRLRIGKYRAIFEIKENEIFIYVLSIDSRGDIYK